MSLEISQVSLTFLNCGRNYEHVFYETNSRSSTRKECGSNRRLGYVMESFLGIGAACWLKSSLVRQYVLMLTVEAHGVAWLNIA